MDADRFGMTRLSAPSRRGLLVLAGLAAAGLAGTAVALGVGRPGDGVPIGGGVLGTMTVVAVVAALHRVDDAWHAGLLEGCSRAEHVVLRAVHPVAGLWGVAVVGAVLAEDATVLLPAALVLVATSALVVGCALLRWRR